MMIFRMDTSEVRAMAARFRRTADMMEMSLASIRQSVQGAPWQSQAREEYILQLEALHSSTLRSVEVLRLMALAAEQKASQWEAIANRFNSPWQPMGNVWSRVLSMMGWVWSRVKNAVSGIRLPSVPRFVLPGGVGFGIVGGLSVVIPPWEFKPPSWWPFNRQPEPQHKLPTGNQPPVAKDIAESKEEIKEPVVDLSENEPSSRPLTSPVLNEVTGRESSYTCATYARARRPDLGSTGHAKGSAYNYKNKFPDQTFQLDNQNGNLQDVVGVGYAVVWEPSHPYADNTHGHVAIVESVYPDHIVISEAVRDSNDVYFIRRKTISIEELNNDHIWFVS